MQSNPYRERRPALTNLAQLDVREWRQLQLQVELLGEALAEGA